MRIVTIQDVEWHVTRTVSFAAAGGRKPIGATTEVIVFTSGVERRVTLAAAGTLAAATEGQLVDLFEDADQGQRR